MKRVNLRVPMCLLCGCAGKKKGGVRSETNPRVFYEKYYACTNKSCMNSTRPQNMRAFEGGIRTFGER